MTKNKTFVRITNQEIYSEIIGIKETLNKIESKTKLAFWMSSTALTITLLIVGSLLSWRL